VTWSQIFPAPVDRSLISIDVISNFVEVILHTTGKRNSARVVVTGPVLLLLADRPEFFFSRLCWRSSS